MAREKAGREKKTARLNWRLWLRMAGWMLMLVSVAFAARQVHRFALSNPHFRLPVTPPEADTPEFTITGLRYASRERVVRVFASDFGRSIFSVPLDERRRRLLAIDWVEDVSIDRDEGAALRGGRAG